MVEARRCPNDSGCESHGFTGPHYVPESATSTEWGVRVVYNTEKIPEFTSAVLSEAHAEMLIAGAAPGVTVTKVSREVTEWVEVPVQD